MTEQAIFQGRAVTPEQFLAMVGPEYRQLRIYPTCPSCGSDLAPYGVHSTKVQSRFDHPDKTGCPLSSTPDARYAFLRPNGWDWAARERLFARLCETENLKETYSVCRRIIPGLNSEEFYRACQRAYQYGVFGYRGIELWVLPYLLVTLEDFPKNDKRSIPYRFVLHKPDHTAIDVLWLEPQNCVLRAYFADTGNPMKRREIRIPDAEAEKGREDTDWMKDPLIRLLRRCCEEHGHASVSAG
uniref:Uncharacterized protein n=1 Tax=mine drainage metagenome TaxID=410659 RepID=E6QGM0_9ZZZZ